MSDYSEIVPDPLKPTKLTPKQRKFLKVWMENGYNATQAAKDTLTCTEDGAAQAGSQMLRRIKVPIAALMDEMGMSDAKLMSALADGLTATKSVVVGQGEAARLEVIPDQGTRKFILELALKVKGHLVQKIQHQDADGKPMGPVILPGIPVKGQSRPQEAGTEPGAPVVPDAPSEPVQA